MTVVTVLWSIFPSLFPLQKTQTGHTNQSVSQQRSSDLLRITLKLLFTFREHPVIKVWDCPGLFIIQKIIPHLAMDLHSGLFSCNAGKWKGDRSTQSSWGFPLARLVCQLFSDSSGWPFGLWAREVIRGFIVDPCIHCINAFFYSSSCCLGHNLYYNLWNKFVREQRRSEHFTFVVFGLQMNQDRPTHRLYK